MLIEPTYVLKRGEGGAGLRPEISTGRKSGVEVGASVQNPSALGEGGEAEAGRWAEDNGHVINSGEGECSRGARGGGCGTSRGGRRAASCLA